MRGVKNPPSVCTQCSLTFHHSHAVSRGSKFCSHQCFRHYRAAEIQSRTQKKCCICEEHFSVDRFSASSIRADGLQSCCKDCELLLRRATQRKSDLRRRFGITELDYEKMLREQNGRCAICKTLPPSIKTKLHIDHDHKTGVVRGLLCHKCNTGLGMFMDNAEIMQSAIDYLDEVR